VILQLLSLVVTAHLKHPSGGRPALVQARAALLPASAAISRQHHDLRLEYQYG
jgi:hypothetical protein